MSVTANKSKRANLNGEGELDVLVRELLVHGSEGLELVVNLLNILRVKEAVRYEQQNAR